MDLSVGSMVLIREEGKPRLSWPLGRVTELFPGKDGLVRAVKLKTQKGHLTRAVQKLHKLEICDQVGSVLNKDTERKNLNAQPDDAPPEADIEPDGPPPTLGPRRSGRPVKPPSVLDL